MKKAFTKKRVFSITAMLITLVMALTACGGGGAGGASSASTAPDATSTPDSTAPAPADGEVIKISVAINVPENDPLHTGWVKFKEVIEEKSGGRFQVTIFGNSSVAGNDREILEKVAEGTTQVGNTTPGTLAAYSNITDFYAFNIPYLYQTPDDIFKMFESDWYKGLCDQFVEKTGVRVYGGGFTMGGWSIGTVKNDLASLDVLKGMKLRIADVPQQIALTEKLGAAPMFISFNEVYTALQQGTMDGLLTTPSLMYTNGFYENLKFIKLTDQGHCIHTYLINDAWYQGLPDDMRAILDESLAETQAANRADEAAIIDYAYEQMRAAGVTIYEMSDEERQMMVDTTKEVVWSNPDAAQVSLETINMLLEIMGYEPFNP